MWVAEWVETLTNSVWLPTPSCSSSGLMPQPAAVLAPNSLWSM